MEFLVGRDFGYHDQIKWLPSDDLRLTAKWESNNVHSKYLSTIWTIGNTLAYRKADEISGGQKRYINRAFINYVLNTAPTNRVRMSFDSRVSYTIDKRISELKPDTERTGLVFIALGKTDYYFSPQLRVSGTVQTILYRSKADLSTRINDLQLVFGLEMIYSYF